MAKGEKPVSRRDLFGFLTKGLAEARDVAKEGFADATPKRSTAAPQAASKLPAREPRRRPASESITAQADQHGRIDVSLPAIAVGGSLRIDCEVAGSPPVPPLVIVRVNETHYAVCTGICASCASDLLYSAPQDLLWCPLCGSRWRLDGSLTRGPASAHLRSWHVDVIEGRARIIPR